MIDFSTPLEGLHRAEARVNQSAARIARAGFPEAGGDQVDLSAEILALLAARTDFGANLKVAETLDQLSRGLLDALG